MVSVMNNDKANLANINIGQWVRVNGGTYKGDLAQIHSIEEHRTKIVVKLIPRIDFNADYDDEEDNDKPKIKRKSLKNRPLPKIFNCDEIDKSKYDKIKSDTGEEFIIYKNMRFKQDGLLYKEVNIKNLTIDNIQPTHEELKSFASILSEEGQEYQMIEEIMNNINE